MPKQIRWFTELFRGRLQENPGFNSRLREAGLPDSAVMSFLNDTWSDQTLIMHAARLLTALGIDVQEVMFRQAQLDFAEEGNSCGTYALAAIGNIAVLRRKLQELRDKLGSAKAAQAVSVHRDTLRDWAQNRAMMRTDSIIKALRALKTLNQRSDGKSPDATDSSSKGAPVDTRRQVAAGLSVLHSSVDLLESVCRSGDFLDGDRVRTLGIIRRLLKLADIDGKTLERLQRAEPVGTDTNDILDVITRLAGKPSARRKR